MEEQKADLFLELTESLSRYRRAELKDDNQKNLIEELYVDPLENDLILKSMKQANTTLLIGRKGTGKSTIINRFQHEVRKTKNTLSLYIDVKALFEQAKKTTFNNLNDNELNLSNEDIEKLNLYIMFVEKIINEINIEIKKDLFAHRFISFFTKKLTKEDFETKLNKLFNDVKIANYQDTTLTQMVNNIEEKDIKKLDKVQSSIETSCVDIKGSFSVENKNTNNNISSKEFTKILTRYFDIISFMNSLKKELQQFGIINVFICLDDMSEIDKVSMEVFTDLIVGPLNNLSDEYFKFKISLYPGRDYLPSIDRQKVKTFCLDYYDLYSIGNSDKVEEQAVKYTKRLLEKRFKYFYGENIDMGDFFDLSNITLNEYYKIIFQISSNVPRIIGKVLEIALQKTNSLERKINKKILQESAKQHYKNDIEYVLTKSEYIEYKSYDEAFEQFHLLNLLNKIIQKAIENKKKIGASNAKIFEKYTSNTAPSNYLYVSEEFEDILKTLEFNFFLTKYSKQKDRESFDISVFSLNYGLCMDNNILYDEKSDRKFRVERIFDFNNIIVDWMNDSKELICTYCDKKYPIEQKDVFIKHKVPCMTCQNEVKLRPIINEKQKEKIDNNIKLPQKEFEVINALNNKMPLSSSELGYELDRAYQSINHSIGKNSKINNYKYIRREEEKNKALFYLTELGKQYILTGK